MSGTLDPQYRKAYILGGNATVTLVSRRSGDRFTYRVQQAKPRPGDSGAPPYFVAVLTGPNNRDDYKFLGTIFGSKFVHGRKSEIAPTSPSARAWAWTWDHLEGPQADQVEVWHEGECSRCGRALTDPESIQRGLGPVCAERATGM